MTDATDESSSLGGGQTQHVAQQQDRSLTRRQKLNGGNEGKVDRLAHLIPRIWARHVVHDPLERRVWIGFEPGDVVCRFAVRHAVRRRTVRLREHAACLLSRREGGQAHVGGNSVQPIPNRGATVEVFQAAPRAQKGFLDQVLGVVERPEHLITVKQQLPSMGLGQALKRVAVTALGRGQKRGFV